MHFFLGALRVNYEFFLFSAGIDTSRLSLRFAILHMAAYPAIQLKVQQEIDRVVGKSYHYGHKPTLFCLI